MRPNGLFMVSAMVITIAASFTRTASAQNTAPAQPPDEPAMGFVEASGAYGMQLGETEYLPIGAGDEFEHPLVHGFAVGATGGIRLVNELFLIGNYEFTRAESRQGEINSVVDEIQGEIQYQTAVLGARLTHKVGVGEFFGELGFGVLFPLETHLDFDYAPEMSQLPTPVTGVGSKTDSYTWGVGGQGLFGYRIPIAQRVYVSTALKIKSFQTNNENETTKFDNFITDFATLQPVNMTIDYDNEGPGQPTTYSVQDIRLQLAVGATF